MRKSISATAAAAALQAALLACTVGRAEADETGLYLGAGITQSQIDHVFGFGSHLRVDDTAWKGFIGFKPPVFPLGLEADYIDLGSRTRNFGFDAGHADAKAFAGFAVGYLPLPLPFVDVYGKAGAARWQFKGYTTTPSLFSVDDRGTDFAWGAGTQFHFQQLAVRVEYEGFDIRNTDGARLLTLGAAFYF